MDEERKDEQIPQTPPQPNAEKTADGEGKNKLLAYFMGKFGKYDIRNEKEFLSFLKWLLFAALLVLDVVMVLQQLNTLDADWLRFALFLGTEIILTVSVALKLFAIQSNTGKIVFYVLDGIAACCISFFMDGLYPLIAHILVLTGFYIGAEKTGASIWLLIISVVVYALFYGLKIYFKGLPIPNLLVLFRDSIGAILLFVCHFLAVHIALAFYQQFLKLESALSELDESKKELEKAYAVVAEVSALEERQRIAKDIHDTAGHSITTVIMQTEAASRILETSPEEAKAKIVAANLQAKHALEELRDSVHLLSGSTQSKTLKDALLGIIHESTDGTGLKIRSSIQDVVVVEAKYRFLCNTLKEGISNGLRHGGATAFWFELKAEDGRISFLLSDNGTGLTTAQLQLGFGLSTMMERAKALGGEIKFDSQTDEGFEILLTLPLDTEE